MKVVAAWDYNQRLKRSGHMSHGIGCPCRPDYPHKGGNVYPFVACYTATGAFRAAPAGIDDHVHTIAGRDSRRAGTSSCDVAAVIPTGGRNLAHASHHPVGTV